MIQDAFRFTLRAGGNFLDKMPRDGLAIIESKSKGFGFLKDVQQLRFDIGLKDALSGNAKFYKCLRSFAKEQREAKEIAITIVIAECSAFIMYKVLEKLEIWENFLFPFGLESFDSYRMTSSLPIVQLRSNRYCEDVVVRVDGFSFFCDFVVVNFEPDPRVPIILRRPFLRTAKALIDLYEETLTLRIGKEELFYYADKSEKNKDKHFVHAISIIDFSKDGPFSGITTIPSDAPFPSSSPIKTSDSTFEEFINEFTLPNSLPPGDDISIHKKDIHEETFSNPLFEFDDTSNMYRNIISL
ncbi:reverse transcriptase domain-containing protein [Tanacetum coccineum]